MAAEWPDLAAVNFRGRHDEATVLRPGALRGLRLGPYPVLAGELGLGPGAQVTEQIRAFHNQVIIARSFLTTEQLVDMHVFLVCDPPRNRKDWRREVDAIERDESVCRKLVWVRGATVAASFDKFAGRTFLARPWTNESIEQDAPLDQNSRLVQDMLIKHGLSPAAADAWIKAASEYTGDPIALVQQLVTTMDTLK